MKLAELINTNHWLSVEMTLLKLYPEQFENIDAYNGIYRNLQEMKVEENKIKIIIDQDYDEETGELCFPDVYGRNDNEKDVLKEALALEFVPWQEWLGMTIEERTMKNFNELEIIAHCLYEMTFMGYEEEEIQNQLLEIMKIEEEYKNMTEEEKKSRTQSVDDFLRELDNEE